MTDESIKCSNCQHLYHGNFCGQCGQPSKEKRGPFWTMAHEIYQEVVAVDSKVIKSIFRLCFQPGKLTRLFLTGKRGQVLPPIRTYLVLSLLFFAVFNIKAPDVSNANVYFSDQLIERKVVLDNAPSFHLMSYKQDTWFARWWESTFPDKIEKLKGMKAQELVDFLFQKSNQTLPNVLILFLPILALILKLLYIRTPALYYDHVVFSLHFQSFLFAFIALVMLLVPLTKYAFAGLLVLPIYLGASIHRVYRQAWYWTLLKTMTLSIVLFTSYITTFIFAMIFVITRV